MWLLLGIVLGNLLPDADNLAVAAATVAGYPTEGLHRTFTHSLFFAGATLLLFYLVARLTHNTKWSNLGIGLGIGVVMHILLDLLIWFNGVEILWPIPSWVNLWTNVTPPEWWNKLMLPLENLAFVFFFLFLAATARKRQTDIEYLPKLRIWTIVQAVLFVFFLVMVFTMKSGFLTIFGAVYLLSLGLAFGITIRMRDTVEATA
jgi:membrane-bound metal-dependent hydrolase YbcI (DUF457 family)